MPSYRIRLEPIGEEFECSDQETVLEAAFRCGFNLEHGCREGRCSACKAFILDGWAHLKQHSSFALTEAEEDEGFTLLCRTVPESDLAIELINYDLADGRLMHNIVDGTGRVALIEPLTHDIRRLVLDVETPDDFNFRPGQFVDIWVPEMGQRRSFSMANLPGEGRLEFIIKLYPDGLFSGMLEDGIRPGDPIRFTGPYGSCYLRDTDGSRDALLVAGGSGMAPVLSLLRQMAADGTDRTVSFFYGARRRSDLFYLDEIEKLGRQIDNFSFLAALSDETPQGETIDLRRVVPVQAGNGLVTIELHYGMVHEVLDRWLTESQMAVDGLDVYMAGPPPMVDATSNTLLVHHGGPSSRLFVDRFTFTGPPLSGPGEEAVQTTPSRATNSTSAKDAF